MFLYGSNCFLFLGLCGVKWAEVFVFKVFCGMMYYVSWLGMWTMRKS